MAVTQYSARTGIGDTFSLGYDDGNGNFLKSADGYKAWLVGKMNGTADKFLTILEDGTEINHPSGSCGGFNAYLATVTVKDE